MGRYTIPIVFALFCFWAFWTLLPHDPIDRIERACVIPGGFRTVMRAFGGALGDQVEDGVDMFAAEIEYACYYMVVRVFYRDNPDARMFVDDLMAEIRERKAEREIERREAKRRGEERRAPAGEDARGEDEGRSEREDG